MSRNTKFYLIIIPALFLQFFASFFYFLLVEPGSAAAAIYAGLKVIMISWPFIGFYYFLRNDMPRLGRDVAPKRGMSLFWGLLCGLAVAVIILSAAQFLHGYLAAAVPALRAKIDGWKLLSNFLLFGFVLCTVNAAFEEYYWRWFVFRGLALKMSWLMAASVSSAAFASHHLVIVAQFFPAWLALMFALAVVGGGFIFTRLYYKTGSLLGSFVAHFFADLAIIAVLHDLLF